MNALQKPCENCHKPMNGGLYRATHICPHCEFAHAGGKRRKFKSVSSAPAKPVEANKPLDKNKPADNKKTAKAAPAKPARPLREPLGLPEVEESEEVYQQAAASDATPEPQAAKATAAKPEPVVEIDQASELEQSAEKAQALESTAEPVQALEPETPSDPIEARTSGRVQNAEVVSHTTTITAADLNRATDVMLTVKPAEEQNVVAYLDEVSAEQVLTMALTADLFEAGKFIGTKSDKVRALLQQGKKQALAELRIKADEMGANMVASVQMKNALKVVDKNTAQVTVSAFGNAITAETAEEAMEA